MIKNLSRRIVFLTALYLCIIFGIFALQFTNGNTFSLSLGSMMVTGAMEPGENGAERPLLPLHVGVWGLDFFLDDQNSLLAYSAEKGGVPLRVVGIEEGQNRFTMQFSEGVSVTFSSEKRGDSDIVTVSAGIPVKYQKIAIPYKIARSARLEKKDSLTLVGTGKKQFYFSGAPVEGPGPNSVRRLTVQRATPVVYYQTWIPAKGLVIAELENLPGATPKAYSSAVETWAANALESFKGTMASGALTENLVAAYIAEMGRIGMYRAAVESIPESWRNGAGRTYLTNTYLDNLVKTNAALVIRERDERTDLSRKLTENDPAAFEFPGLVPYLVDRGSTVLLKDVSRLASALDISSLSALQAAGILEAMMDYGVYAPGQENPLLPLADSCERRIKASLVRIQDKLYLSDDGKTISAAESLRVAPVLIRYGSASGAGWSAAGRLLVTSLVSFAGERASLPAKFSVATGEGNASGIVARPEQILDPVSLYPVIVADSTWYPHALSLSADAGPGVWAWTVAQSVRIAAQADRSIKITTRFPQGETHYMTIRGIKPFARIVIYGMDFRSDPRYESYNSSGYVYNAETETLFLKMRHKAEYEEVVLYPASATVSAPASSAAAPADPAVSAQPAVPPASAAPTAQ